jgi:phosphoribosylglycinamide formyltransferase-1
MKLCFSFSSGGIGAVGLSIGWFSTGRDEAARRLLQIVVEGVRSGLLPLEIAFVFVNREKGESPESDIFLDQVAGYGLPLVAFSSKDFQPQLRLRGLRGDTEALETWRRMYHAEVFRLISPFHVAFSFLAGYMLIVSADMCNRLKMLNLHPALPGGPKGTWQEVIWQLIRQRATEAGAMVHLVIPELDAGPPVAYCRFSLTGQEFLPLWRELDGKLAERTLEQIERDEGEDNPLFRLIRRYEFARELPLIINTLEKIGRGTIEIKNGNVFINGHPCPGADLSAEVDAMLLTGSPVLD